MRIVWRQTILMKYHALFVIFEKAANLKLSSAANYRWHFMGKIEFKHSKDQCIFLQKFLESFWKYEGVTINIIQTRHVTVTWQMPPKVISLE